MEADEMGGYTDLLDSQELVLEFFSVDVQE
jgi:hypothetical protein